MGLFGKKKQKRKNEIMLEERMSSGQFNWRLKEDINASKKHPNFLNFIAEYEEKNQIQFGLNSDHIDSTWEALALRQGIYNSKGNVKYNFTFTFIYNYETSQVVFTGYISDFMNPREMLQPEKEKMTTIETNSTEDLSIQEYEKYHKECLNQSLSLLGLNPNEFYIIGNLGCVNKMLENKVREQYY